MHAFDDSYSELRFNEWEEFRLRYERYREFLLAEGGDAADEFADRLWECFEAGAPGPLLFAESDDRSGVLTEVLDSCDVEERTWLKQHPEYLGLRCEARLRGCASESLWGSADGAQLGEIVLDTLTYGLPSLDGFGQPSWVRSTS